MESTTTPTDLVWSDLLGSRSREAWLLLVKGENVHVFTGQGIAGVVVVRGTDYKKNGKWSHTTYRLELLPGVRAIPGRDGWETNRFTEGLQAAVHRRDPIDTWSDVASALGISVPGAMKFLREWRPKAARTLDEVDAKLSELDDLADAAATEADTVQVVVSFGSPTRRQRSEGFWESPKGIPDHRGADVRLIDHAKGWEDGNVQVHGMAGTVLSVVRTGGHGGGYVSVTVAVVPGTISVQDPPTDELVVTDELAVSTIVPVPAPEPLPPQPLSGDELAASLARLGANGKLKFARR